MLTSQLKKYPYALFRPIVYTPYTKIEAVGVSSAGFT